MIIEADKSLDLDKLEAQESQWLSFSLNPKAWEPGELMVSSSKLKAGRRETWEELFGFESKGRKKANVPVWRLSGSALLFYSSLQVIGWGPPTLGRIICFIQVYQFKC